MTQKVIQIGSSLGVTIRQDALEALGLQKGDAVQVSVNESTQRIEISAKQREAFAKELAQAQKLVEAHRDELAKLQGE